MLAFSDFSDYIEDQRLQDADFAIKAEQPAPERQLKTIEDTMRYMHAGRAVFTLRNSKTQNRFTFKVVKSKPSAKYPTIVWFLKYLYGPQNTTDYRNLGIIRNPALAKQETLFDATASVQIMYPLRDSQPGKVFKAFYEMLVSGKLPAGLEIWHSGHCGRCNRLLTVPKSIANGIGPECEKKGWF